MVKFGEEVQHPAQSTRRVAEHVKAHAPCTRLNPGTNIRCGKGAMAVVHLYRNGIEYLAYVCDVHYHEAVALARVALADGGETELGDMLS